MAQARLLSLLLALLLAITQAALLIDSARGMSDTVDENIYLPAAGLLWAHGDFTVNAESPVLPKWAFALAMRIADRALDATPPTPGGADEYVLWYGGPERTQRVLFAARLASVIVTVLAGLLMWRIASRWGAVSGLVAHALWCFSPTVLAAGALATLDAWVLAGVVAIAGATALLVEKPSASRWVLLGAVSGLALACKVTALAAVPLATIAGVWGDLFARGSAAPGPPEQGGVRRTLGHLGLWAGAAVLSLWAVYGFTVGPVRVQALQGLPATVGAALPSVPFPAWIQGLLAQIGHGTRGHRNYLFGETSLSGWWWFYLAALALKTTLGAQALTLLLAAAWLRHRPRGDAFWLDILLLTHSVIVLAVMSAGRTQLGIKYLLPAFPTAMLWAAHTFPRLAALVPRAGTLAGTVALAAGALGTLHVHPHYLMFFNSWVGGPARGPRYLVTGDCIGQDQRRLADWQRREGLEWIYYTWYSGRPEHWGVKYADPPCLPLAGVYALEAIEVHRPRRIAAGCLDWLIVDPPEERVGRSIYVYRVTRERARRLRAVPAGTPPFWLNPRRPSSGE